MADTVSPEQRSKNMAAIRSKNTKPEIMFRKWLFAKGFRYRIYAEYIEGKPDMFSRKYNTAIFVNGCFWHRHKGCKYCYMPKTRTEYWKNKFEKNIERDERVKDILIASDIRVLIVWECSIKRMLKEDEFREAAIKAVFEFLFSDLYYMEI